MYHLMTPLMESAEFKTGVVAVLTRQVQLAHAAQPHGPERARHVVHHVAVCAHGRAVQVHAIPRSGCRYTASTLPFITYLQVMTLDHDRRGGVG